MRLTYNQKVFLFIVAAYLIYKHYIENRQEGFSKINCSNFATKKSCPSIGCFWNPAKQRCVKP